MLTEQQKDDLYQVLTRVLGPDPVFENAKKDFNEETIVAVEAAIDANISKRSTNNRLAIAANR